MIILFIIGLGGGACLTLGISLLTVQFRNYSKYEVIKGTYLGKEKTTSGYGMALIKLDSKEIIACEDVRSANIPDPKTEQEQKNMNVTRPIVGQEYDMYYWKENLNRNVKYDNQRVLYSFHFSDESFSKPLTKKQFVLGCVTLLLGILLIFFGVAILL